MKGYSSGRSVPKNADSWDDARFIRFGIGPRNLSLSIVGDSISIDYNLSTLSKGGPRASTVHCYWLVCSLSPNSLCVQNRPLTVVRQSVPLKADSRLEVQEERMFRELINKLCWDRISCGISDLAGQQR